MKGSEQADQKRHFVSDPLMRHHNTKQGEAHMNLDRYEDTSLQDDVAASPKADDTDLSDEALDRVPVRGAFSGCLCGCDGW
jgi:hypothetical protein